MQFKTFILASLLFFFGCINSAAPLQETIIRHMADNKENPYPLISAIPLPAGFERIHSADGSFAYWLRNVHLKKDKTVYKYDGNPKANQEAQFAVLDITIGNRDLQQCADAVMRLRAEYLFDRGRFDEIIFYDNDGKRYAFDKPYNRDHFNSYLQRIFGICGSASLSKQLHTVSKLNDIIPGDVLIRGGFPGHAVIVMDVAINVQGVKAYLIAQSYMPAQDIHVLINPENENRSPWYIVHDALLIETPEYTFRSNELKRW